MVLILELRIMIPLAYCLFSYYMFIELSSRGKILSSHDPSIALPPDSNR
jgi:hypothetical protein